MRCRKLHLSNSDLLFLLNVGVSDPDDLLDAGDRRYAKRLAKRIAAYLNKVETPA